MSNRPTPLVLLTAGDDVLAYPDARQEQTSDLHDQDGNELNAGIAYERAKGQ